MSGPRFAHIPAGMSLIGEIGAMAMQGRRAAMMADQAAIDAAATNYKTSSEWLDQQRWPNTNTGADGYKQAMPSTATPISQPKMRTPEEITAQLEARYAEMERQAKSPERLYQCKACRWSNGSNKGKCSNALVTGLDKKDHELYWGLPPLCGPEKALWEPIPERPTLWTRFLDWLGKVWGIE